MSIDPVTTDANTGSSFNRYAYAENNPYKYIDPDGRDPQPITDQQAQFMQASTMLGWFSGAMNQAPMPNMGPALASMMIKNEAAAVAKPAAGAAIVAGKEAVAVAGKITGYTKHGLNQAISRDGGRGVAPTAILAAVKDPIKVTEQAGGKLMYTGKDAKVVLNSEGKVVTLIPRNSQALRDPNVK